MKPMTNSNSDANIQKGTNVSPRLKREWSKEGVVVENPAARVMITTKRHGPAGGKSPNFYRLLVSQFAACICTSRLQLP